MKKTLFALLMLLAPLVHSEDVWVNGYSRKDGTQVEGHYRSAPNAYKWDNKSYEPNQPAYNNSYSNPTRNYNDNYYKPSETRYQDTNPYNDSPPSGYSKYGKFPGN